MVVIFYGKMHLDVGNEPYLSDQYCLTHLVRHEFFLECIHYHVEIDGHEVIMYLYDLAQSQVERTTMVLFFSS